MEARAQPRMQEYCSINGTLARCRLDCGADLSVIGENQANKYHCKIEMDQNAQKLGGPDASPLKIVGTTAATIEISKVTMKHRLIVFKFLAEGILLGEDLIMRHPELRKHLRAMRNLMCYEPRARGQQTEIRTSFISNIT